MKNKKIIIFSIVISFLIGLLVYVFFNPEHYVLQVKTGTNYNYATGILVKNFWKGSFYLNVNFDNPNEHCVVGLFVYDKDSENLKLLESSGGMSDSGKCMAIQTSSGYAITNKTFMRREKSYHNGNIINQMANNKENTYLCISSKSIYELTVEDCYKVDFIKY